MQETKTMIVSTTVLTLNTLQLSGLPVRNFHAQSYVVIFPSQ